MDLNASRISSQHGEDGVVDFITKVLDLKSGLSFELGAGDNGGCTAILAATSEYISYFVEEDAKLAQDLRDAFPWSNVKIIQESVTPENVNSIINVPATVISCDIDSIDYWVLKSLACVPDLFIVEYNASLGALASVTVPRSFTYLERTESMKRAQYYGCSLSSLHKLLVPRDMSLIYCDKSGTNAFFVHNRHSDRFSALSPIEAYRSSKRSKKANSRGLSPEKIIESFPWEQV